MDVDIPSVTVKYLFANFDCNSTLAATTRFGSVWQIELGLFVLCEKNVSWDSLTLKMPVR